MPSKKKIEDIPKTNGFPLNGGFPEWITRKTCGNCKDVIKFSDYKEIGFFIGGDSYGKLFVRYECQKCGNKSTIEFGDNEKFTIERLCTLVMQHSNILKASDKVKWKVKHVKP